MISLKYVFSLIYMYYPLSAFLRKIKTVLQHAKRLGSHDYFMSCIEHLTQINNMDECRISRIACFDAILCRLGWELEDCNKIAG